ncbi:ATP-dependent helicase [Halomicronema sp. CCY15110]|uniref:ATP-dependent helicase n=1 Tax=Halomicronema sp. CCY15110 TaxID=2767773 RepID=UPI00194F2B30|nr:ATP-dependent helicase [Halomicronema sp. CCY15110]
MAEAIATDRAATLTEIRDSLRAGQRSLADWQGGPLAVSAVPGAGKSTGMAAGAAIAIERHGLNAKRQLVLVTFTRSAAANLKAKVQRHLRSLQYPLNSFVVYTLHGLALTIATRNPDLSGISLDTLTLLTPTQNNRLIRTCVERWLVDHPDLYQRLIEGRQFDGEETERLRRQSTLRTEILPNLATTVIHEAKSSGMTPTELARLAASVTRTLTDDVEDYDVLTVAAGLYEQYQTLLSQRHLIDYDDMILSALRVLADDEARRFWQNRVFAVFEDEAQDSSPLQTQLLETLAQDAEDATAPLNLVRVGDPNQAINSTFTPADPVFFNQFCDRAQQQKRLVVMDQAGRSSAVIMAAANAMLTWVNQSGLAGTLAPFRSQAIHPVPGDDPQPDANPAPIGGGVEFYRPPTVTETVRLLAQRSLALHTENPSLSQAILVREHRQGRFIHQLLNDPETLGIDLLSTGLQIYDVGEQERQTHVPSEMLTILQFIERPHSPDRLKALLRVFVDRQRIASQDLNLLAKQPEQFMYPGPLDSPPLTDAAEQARRLCTGLLRSRFELPPYHLIPFAGLTLGYNQSELATADKLAARLSQQNREDNTLRAMINTLQEIVGSERFEAVDTEDREDRYTRRGQLTILTMHKAKGLDWDVVFLPFLHERTIPGNLWVPQQQTFLGDFSLPEVARAQIRVHTHAEPTPAPIPDLLTAWQQAKNLKTAEEFRLLYVAMTRAKRLLWMTAAHSAPFTWSNPDNLSELPPCAALPVVMAELAEVRAR